jgi:hypothetical protein
LKFDAARLGLSTSVWEEADGMPLISAGRKGAAAIIAALAIWYASASQRTLAETGGFVRDGTAGFIVTQFGYALGPDAADTGSCPAGMFKNVAEIFGESGIGRRKPGESDEVYSERLEEGGKAISKTLDGKDYCTNPALAPQDPHARYHINPAARAEGLNLDDKVSRSPADIASGQLDFVGLDGTQGIDNQFWRVVGCSKPYQKAGHAVGFGQEMYAGSWGLLVLLEDLDDVRNDDHVTVRLYSNADPMQLSPSREALDYATYAYDPDPAYRAETTGKLKDGVLTTGLFDFRFKRVTNAMYVDRPLNQARIRATLSPDGTVKGYLAGYTPVEQLYDFQFGYRTAKKADGSPADPRRVIGTANGAARTLGYTCQGMYQGLHRLADGGYDQARRKFTSISTQYRFEARPAFVVKADTKSVNDALVKK